MKQKNSDRYWNGRERPATKAEFFNAVTTPAPSGDGTVATIRLYGPIDSWGGWWGISTKDVGQVLDALPDTVEQIVLRINSPGGEVFEGVAILNMLRAHKATVTAVVDGLAASAASVIAAGCDDTVMSPGTQMMIHQPSVLTWGNSSDLRKDADILDGIEASIIEIYTDKAGVKDWATMLADETWMTAAEAVELGLADRVAVVPDAGESATVGEEDPDIFIIQPNEDDEDDDAEDAARGRYASLHERVAALAPKTPVSSEPVEHQKKEDRVSDTLKAGLRERLGVTDADASDEALLAAVDELTEAATAPTPPAVPAGTTLIDSAQLTQLQADAQAGREARDAQIRARREQIVNDALADGRIAPANRDGWLAQLEANEESATQLIAALPKGTVPVDELGHSDTITSAEDALYARVYPTKEA
jgi:ATP-dependent protease ClpP protease subunit